MASDPSPSSPPSISSSSPANASADSYIGSLINLTSKSEIRYEGVIVSINTRDSTIALRNVRSFGTEGRKKDGPQVPPSEKVYEYILFRGSDIKDLQVKRSPSLKPQDYDDPAIIQSHRTSSPTTSTVDSKAETDSGSNSGQPALGRPLINDASASCQCTMDPLPTLQHSFAVYRPTYYRGSTTTQSQEQYNEPTSTVRALPTPKNHLQYPVDQTSVNSNLPAYSKTSDSLVSSSHVIPPQFTDSNFTNAISSYTTANNFRPHSSVLPTPLPQATAKLASSSGPSFSAPALLTPDHLIPSRSIASYSSQALYSGTIDNDEALLPLPPNLHHSIPAFPQAPLLPLPASLQQPQQSGSHFSEEFDFSAMNEKFNKDEVWGSLGKTRHVWEGGDGPHENPIGKTVVWKGGPEKASIYDRKTVYNKDEFFDTLSCDSFNRGGWNGRAKFSERVKLNTETFGDFQQWPSSDHGNFGGPSGNFRGGYYNRGRGYGN